MPIFFIIYTLLPCLTYPLSSTVFAGIGIQALTFLYIVNAKEYLLPYNVYRISRKKWQMVIIVALLLFEMVDWKLVVDSTRDLTIFGTLFFNTIYYCVILLHFIMDNFLGKVSYSGYAFKYFFDWDRKTIQILTHSYAIVLWMTLVSPKWRGNW